MILQCSIGTFATRGGIQSVTFLTELGLCRVLSRSRKQVARTFKKWVANVVMENRLNCTYELKKHLDLETSETREEEHHLEATEAEASNALAAKE